MEQQWYASRSLIPQSDGQRRWDLVYQLLWQWTLERSMQVPTSAPFQQEEPHESSPLRPSLHRKPTTETDD